MQLLTAGMINNGFQITRLSKANIGDVEQLHFAVYGRRMPGYFEKKYDTAYTGTGNLGFIAYSNEGMPIAFYGVIPCFLSINKRPVLSAQSADTMTHPDHRNKGLFVVLAKLTYQLCMEVGITLIFGFPNQNSLPGFIHKLGWQKTEEMDCFVIPVNTLPLEKLSHKLPLVKSAYRVYTRLSMRRLLNPATGVASSVLTNGFDGIYRDAAYLNYKTYTKTFVIAIDQTSIWLKINNGLIIGDMSGVNPDNFDTIMNRLRKLAQWLGLIQIQFHSSAGTALHSLFNARYSAMPSFPVICKVINGNPDPVKISFTFADIDIF